MSNSKSTDNNRNNILSRLRQTDVVATAPLDRSQISVHDDWDTEERIRRFRERMEAVRAEIVECNSSDLLDLILSICEDKSIQSLLLSAESDWAQSLQKPVGKISPTNGASPTLKTYDQNVEEWKQELFYDTNASITSTLGGIAETGTLILWPTPEEPRLMSLVPPIHIAILEVDKLYTTFAEAIKEQDWASQMPTNALLVSGPSKTADIEQTLAYGVHGPKELIVILVE